MKKMMNLMCAACLAVTVTAAALPAEIAVYAEETAPTSGTLQGGQTWTLDGNGTLTISGTGEMKERQETDYPWDLQREAVKKLVIQDGVTNIGSYAFHDCHALAEVTIPQSVMKIASYAFDECRLLKEVKLPQSLTYIGAGAFYSCSALAEINIPQSVTYIGRGAFNFCHKLVGVEIPKSVTTIEEGAFGYCNGLESITVDPENPNYCDVDGVLFSKDKTELLKYPAGKTQTSYVIPDGVTLIDYVAFQSANKLAEITFPASVDRIENFVFTGTQWLKDRLAENPMVVVNGILINAEQCEGDVTVPENVKIIGDWAFYNSKVTSVILPEYVIRVDESAFYGVKTLRALTVKNPDCQFPSYDSALENTTIYGLPGSTAEAFAQAHKYNFAEIESAPVQTALSGDIDGNGTVEVGDAQKALNAYAEIIAGNDPKLTDVQKKAADVDNDGRIDVTDAQYILLYYVENSIAGKPISWADIIGK